MGAALCRQYMLSAFNRRAEFDVDSSHMFLQGVLAAFTLGGGGLEMPVPEAAWYWYEARLPLC